MDTSCWGKVDKICNKIIMLCNKMSGVTVVLAASCAMSYLGFKKDMPDYLLVLLIVQSALLGFATLRGYVTGLNSIWSDFDAYGRRWHFLAFLVSLTLTMTPTATVVMLTRSFVP